MEYAKSDIMQAEDIAISYPDGGRGVRWRDQGLLGKFLMRKMGISEPKNLWPPLHGFGGLVVSMLASGTQVCGFKPGRSRWIFRT